MFRSAIWNIWARFILNFQIGFKLYDSRARPRSAIPSRRRPSSTDIDHRWTPSSEQLCLYSLALEESSPFQPLRATVVPRQNVSEIFNWLTSTIFFYPWTNLTNVSRIYLPGTNDTCVAIGVNENYEAGSVFLKPVLENCPNCQRCFVNRSSSERWVNLEYFIASIYQEYLW